MLILVLNFNGKHHLEDCFQSLREQTRQDFEAILIDNASTDGSLEFMRQRFPEVRLLQMPANLGFCRAYNIALRQADAKWVFLLNNDTRLDKLCIERVWQAIESRPKVSVFALKMVSFDHPDRIDCAGLGFSKYGVSFDRGLSKPSNDPAYTKDRLVFGGCGGAVVYRRSILDDVGLFDDDFEAYAEDVDLAFRMQLAGYICLYVSGAVVRHKRRATSRARLDWVVYMTHRNMEYVLIKNMPTKLLRHCLPLHVAYVAMSMAKWSLWGYARDTMRAKISVWRAWATLKRKRAEIQRQRRVSNDYIQSLFEPIDVFERLRPPE